MKPAEEILEIHLTPMIARAKDSYKTIDEMKQVPEWEVCVNAIKQAQKEAYNEALNDAALLGRVKNKMIQSGDHPVYQYVVDTDSILKLKK